MIQIFLDKPKNLIQIIRVYSFYLLGINMPPDFGCITEYWYDYRVNNQNNQTFFVIVKLKGWIFFLVSSLRLCHLLTVCIFVGGLTPGALTSSKGHMKRYVLVCWFVLINFHFQNFISRIPSMPHGFGSRSDLMICWAESTSRQGLQRFSANNICHHWRRKS